MGDRKDRGRSYIRCLEEVKNTCTAKSLKLVHAKAKCMEGEQWKGSVNGTDCGVNVKVKGLKR